MGSQGGEIAINTTLKRWLINKGRSSGISIVQSQIQQAAARIIVGVAVVAYLYLFGPHFDIYQPYLLPLAGLYLLGSLISIPAIRRYPLSALRNLSYPLIDIALVSFAMLIDGGHTSGLYFLLLVIIFSNGLRWGNALLVYCQALSILGLITVSIVTLIHMQLDIDRSLLFWQIMTLVAVPMYVYLIADKAERVKHEQQQSGETSFKLLDQGPIPVFTFDLDEHEMPRIHYANAAINQVFRDDLTHLVGERPDILTILEDGHEMVDFCRRAMLSVSKEPHVVYVRGKNKQGEILQLMCNASRMRWRNRWLGICFVLDITRLESMRSWLEEARMRGYMSTLISTMVHDFRNVLTNIIGFAEVMQMESDNADEKAKLDAIIATGERGSDMLNRLPQLAKRWNQPGSKEPEKLSRSMLESTIGVARMQLKPDVQLHCNIEEHLPATSVSPVEIGDMLLNLVQNSIHAVQKSGLIEVAIWRDTRDALAKPGKPSLGIRVADNGHGISEEDLPHIFEPFWSSEPDAGGSGLGLAVIKRMVDRCGGRIDVQSSPKRGTSITVQLPAAGSETARPLPAAKPEPTAAAATTQEEVAVRPCRILLVDDAPDVLSIHQALLKRLKHEVETALNGQQALEIFQKSSNPFDLVITDYRMPRMSGLELATAIRSESPDIPILIITAYGEEEQLQKAGTQGIRLLNKPVSLAKLGQTIRDIMRS
ncbi:MAG TPA: ATP-binding protein [Mariprofundaceae bacterium]|nr:ATP-binding protein [Mariprofundaceae bacterium]